MKKVKEELLLSTIFVGKWLALGLGAFGILYFAVYTAYHKSYFDPRMASFDLDISIIQNKKDELEETISALNIGLESIEEKLKNLEDNRLPSSEKNIEKSKLSIKRLGLNWWDNISMPMIKKDKDTEDAFKKLEAAEKEKLKIVEKIESLKNKRDKSNNSIANNTDDIKDYEKDISELVLDKRKAEVELKGPLLWFLGFLGLT